MKVEKVDQVKVGVSSVRDRRLYVSKSRVGGHNV